MSSHSEIDLNLFNKAQHLISQSISKNLKHFSDTQYFQLKVKKTKFVKRYPHPKSAAPSSRPNTRVWTFFHSVRKNNFKFKGSLIVLPPRPPLLTP